MKRAIQIVGVLVVLLLAAALALPFLLDANQFRPLLQSKLTVALGREVTLGSLELSIFTGSVTAGDLSIADDPAFSKTPFLRASSLQAGIELMPLILSRKLNVTGIVIDQPQIQLVQNQAGVWNFSSIGAKSPAAPEPASPPTDSSAPSLSVADVKITNGSLSLAKNAPGAKSPPLPLVVEKLNIEVKNFSADSPFTFTLTAAFSGAGTVKLGGKAGPINAGNAIGTPLNATLQVAHLDLGISGVVHPAVGITGIVSVDGTVSSNGASVQTSGKLKAEQLKLVKTGTPAKRTLEVDFALDQDLKKQAGDIKRGDIHFGKAVASLTGAYNVSGEVPTVNLKLVGNKLDVTEVGAFLPALDVVLPAGASIQQGTADVNFTAEGPADKLAATGSIGLDGVQLANYDLAGKLTVLDQLAGIKASPHTEIQTLRASVKSSRAGTDLNDIDLLVPSIGEITGAGSISPAHALDFKMRAALHSAVGVMAGLGSKGGIPFTISGTAESPSFKPDVKGMAVDKLKDVTKMGDVTGGFLKGVLGGKKK